MQASGTLPSSWVGQMSPKCPPPQGDLVSFPCLPGPENSDEDVLTLSSCPSLSPSKQGAEEERGPTRLLQMSGQPPLGSRGLGEEALRATRLEAGLPSSSPAWLPVGLRPASPIDRSPLSGLSVELPSLASGGFSLPYPCRAPCSLLGLLPPL